MCYSNFVPKKCRFSDIWPQKCCDLEIWVRAHSRSLKVVPFDRLCIVSYYHPIVTLSARRTIFQIFDFKKWREFENQVRGPWRSLKILPFDTEPVSRVISEIFNVEKYRDLEIPVKGQSRSSKVVPFDRLVSFLLVLCSNFVPQTNRFWDIRIKNAVTLKTGLGVRKGHWKCHHLIEQIRLSIDVL